MVMKISFIKRCLEYYSHRSVRRLRARLGFSLATLLVLSIAIVPTVSLAGSTAAAVIQMTDKGLVPNDLQVQRGTTVFFLNTGKYTHWPASNNHPSHEMYPGFDSRETIQPGTSWQFKFDKLGTWKMHDHLNPGFEAEITVVEDLASIDLETNSTDASNSSSFFLSISEFFAGLSGNSSTNQNSESVVTASPKLVDFTCTGQNATNFECYKHYYKSKVRSDGIAAAFTDAKQREKNNAYALSMCHPIVHAIGHAAVEKFDNVTDAFEHGDSHCWSGYYHGVMEGIIARIGRDQLPNQIDSICSVIPGKATKDFDYFNCIHGLGHGVMASNGIELFDSLELCSKLTGSWEQSSCYGGVYMENIMVDYRNQHTKYLKPEDPVYPCNAVEDQYKNDCFLMQTSYMLKVANGNFGKIFEMCADVLGRYRLTCFQSLGRDAASRSSNDVHATKTTCDLGRSIDEKSNCIIGASKNFVSALHDDQRAKSLCQATDAKIQQICFKTVENYYQYF